MPMWLNGGYFYTRNYKVINYIKKYNEKNNDNNRRRHHTDETEKPCIHQREWREPWWDKEDIITVCSKDKTQYGDEWNDWKYMDKCKFKGCENKCSKAPCFDKKYKMNEVDIMIEEIIKEVRKALEIIDNNTPIDLEEFNSPIYAFNCNEINCDYCPFYREDDFCTNLTLEEFKDMAQIYLIK